MLKKYLIVFLILISVPLFFTACSRNDEDSANYIKLFFPGGSYENWVVEEKELPSDPIIIVNELMKNPKSRIPKDTELLSFEVKDNIAYVNLSIEFEDMTTLGDMGIWQNIFSIVNTLCLNENLGINSVQFLLEGEIQQFIGDTVTDKPSHPSIKQ